MKKLTLLNMVVCAASLLLLNSCMFSQQQQKVVDMQAPVRELTEHEKFILKGTYPLTMDIYRNEELMKQTTRRNARIYICLDQQRGRLYVNDQVAADWPVSTGVQGRETPTGSYRITQKEKEYASNRYGKMYNAEGRCINRDADAFNDPIPEGGKFVGSPMPNWMRLTSCGVGMHTGKVRAGTRLSHGCIRTPHFMAEQLFELVPSGTRVIITQPTEDAYPKGDLLESKLYEKLVRTACQDAHRETLYAKAAVQRALLKGN